MDRDPLHALSLCSGYGGLDLGLAAGLDACSGRTARVVCHVEREAFPAAILARRMAEEGVATAPVWSDLRTFDGRPWRGVVDCITGGYPCQPFSFAGERKGEADPRHLWPEVARIVAEVEPGLVFFENVGGHLSLGFDDVAGDLHRLGYRVAAGLFSAAEVGAPHRRERLFIFGVADTDGAGCGGRWIGQREDGDTEPRIEAALFPPGPGARVEWERILRVRPDLAPATQPRVRGVADGAAGRLDRLRALGNGVVPLAAAYAFCSLWACLEA